MTAPETPQAAAKNDTTRRLATGVTLWSIGFGATIAPLFLPVGAAARWLIPVVWLIATAAAWYLCQASIKWRIARAVTQLQLIGALAQAMRQQAATQQPEVTECSTSPSGPPAPAPDTTGKSATPRTRKYWPKAAKPAQIRTQPKLSSKRLFGGRCAPEAVQVTLTHRNGITKGKWIR